MIKEKQSGSEQVRIVLSAQTEAVHKLYFSFFITDSGGKDMEFICGALAAMCAMLFIMLIYEKKKQPKTEKEKNEADEKESDGVAWEITKTKSPTRDQQYINMLLYDGRPQTDGMEEFK